MESQWKRKKTLQSMAAKKNYKRKIEKNHKTVKIFVNRFFVKQAIPALIITVQPGPVKHER